MRIFPLALLLASCLPRPAPPPYPSSDMGADSDLDKPHRKPDLSLPVDFSVSPADLSISLDLTLLPTPPPIPDLAIPSPPPSPPPSPAPGSARIPVHLHQTAPGATIISFGVPVAPDMLADVSGVGVISVKDGHAIAAVVVETLADFDAGGVRRGTRAFRVQFPATEMPGSDLDIEVWTNITAKQSIDPVVPFSSVAISMDSPATADTTVRTIVATDGGAAFVEAPHIVQTLFTGKEPRVLATFQPGYLAHTGILGQLETTADAADPSLAGVHYLSDAAINFALSAMYLESYALNPATDSVQDPVTNYEAWLYDRCATFLSVYLHTEDIRFLRHAYRTCSYYASKITLTGMDSGTFSGKTPADNKYSHLRGLYAYFALTGDETAKAAAQAIADMWSIEPTFVVPYQQGHIRGIDKLWTERLLGTSMEGLFYGFRFTGTPKYLQGFGQLLDTAYRHITGDAAALAIINPGANFPPQNCFIHNAAQQGEGVTADPWCSPWMSDLTIDVLLQYQKLTADPRPDEIFVRLTRFLRDDGTHYFSDCNHPDDTFMAPSMCDALGENRRQLVPWYGAALRADGTRYTANNIDREHCPDATALTAVGIRSLKRLGKYDANPVGPFASEGASFLQLHHELSACARRLFSPISIAPGWGKTRLNRDPNTYSRVDLAPHVADAATFIANNKIGYPVHVISPLREVSWWFNMSMLQFGLLSDASISIPKLTAGLVPGGSAVTANCGTLTCITNPPQLRPTKRDKKERRRPIEKHQSSAPKVIVPMT